MKTTKNGVWMLGLCALAMGGASFVRAQEGMDGGPAVINSGMDAQMTAKQENARMLIQTLSEEKTEINTLAAQQAMLRRMGGGENQRLARMWGQWIREHKAAAPTLMRLIRRNGGDPMEAKILKPPVLGRREVMLEATHQDHVNAVTTSQMRYGMTNSRAIKTAMRKRANLARKHLRQMEPYHSDHQDMQDMAVQG